MSWRSRSFGSYPWWKCACCSADRQPTAEPPILPVTKHGCVTTKRTGRQPSVSPSDATAITPEAFDNHVNARLGIAICYHVSPARCRATAGLEGRQKHPNLVTVSNSPIA